MTDLPGQAIYHYHFKKGKHKLFVHDTFGPKVEMPVSLYFRNCKTMPELEKKALSLCDGAVLDVGAGAGSHSLELQKLVKNVTALEISPAACAVMRDRGVENVICEDFYNLQGQKFDTFLLLMNGIGICATMEGFKNFLNKADELLNSGGKVIFDSCDVAYMYEDAEMPEHYYGEVSCRYEYQKNFTSWFQWLYLDEATMQTIANAQGWHSEILFRDNNSQYLAVLQKM